MKLSKLSFLVALIIVINSCSHQPRIVKTITLSEVSNPHEIISDDDHLIISDGVEGTTILIYDQKNFSLFSKFEGTGDSTGKFIVSEGHEVGMDIRNDTLLISSHWKTTFTTKKGTIINESDIDHDTYKYQFLGDKFTGQDDTTVDDIMFYTFNLYNQQFEVESEITRIAGSNQGEKGLQVLTRKYQGLTYKGKYYLKGKRDDFEIEVYNSDGTRSDTITHTCMRVPVGEKHKNEVYRSYQEHPLFGQFFNRIKERIVFPENLPAIYKFNIANDFIYVLTYEINDSNSLMYKLDLNGKLMDKKYVPIEWDGMETCPYTISGNYLYQLVKDNADNWNLRIVEL